MAKKIVISLLLLVVLGGALWENFYISGITKRLTETLEKVKTALEEEDYGTAQYCAEEFRKQWDKEKHLGEALFNHNEIDVITASAQQIKSLCETQSGEDALAEVSATLFYVDHLHELNSVRWENVF